MVLSHRSIYYYKRYSEVVVTKTLVMETGVMKPKKHKFILEFTDMELGRTERDWRRTMEMALEKGLHSMYPEGYIQNLQLKSYRRVEQGRRVNVNSKSNS